jgi:hypothetical protein
MWRKLLRTCVLILLYVSSYYYIYVLILPYTTAVELAADVQADVAQVKHYITFKYICVLILLNTRPDTITYTHACARTHTHTLLQRNSSYYYIRVLILLHTHTRVRARTHTHITAEALEADVEEVVVQVKHSKALKTQMTVLLDKIRAISKSSEYIETSRQNSRVRNAEDFLLGVHARIEKGEFCSLSLPPPPSLCIYTLYILKFFLGVHERIEKVEFCLSRARALSLSLSTHTPTHARARTHTHTHNI